MLTDTLMSRLPKGPFARLNDLLGEIKPGKEAINLSVGDPSGAVPSFVRDALAKAENSFGTYPPIGGSEEWQSAAADWLNRRFGLDGRIDRHHLLPLNGTREGLFLALFPLLPLSKSGGKPIVAMPNPFYQAYAAAALGANAEPLYVPATQAHGFLPDYAGLPEAVLERLAAVYICSPSNPEGAAASEDYWRDLFALAERHDFIVLADECYADIYYDRPPPCALSTRLKQSGNFRRLLTFHSLSKRSGLPGLRSGMVAGDPGLIARFLAFRNVAGPQMPGPIMAAAAAAWRDEAHVAANRACYAEKMAVAERLLGNAAAFRKPAGGFFLWLHTGNGEETARDLWREQGVKVLPGAYMGREIEPGKTQSNPGFSYIRVALVKDLSTIMAALERVRDFLEAR
jgi:N-succinyldiaminopimelate aminotransferase